MVHKLDIRWRRVLSFAARPLWGFCTSWFWGSAGNHKLLDCRWYALLLTRTVNTPLALCKAWGGTLDVTGRMLIAMAVRLVIEVGWRRCCLEDCWECLLFTGARSLGRAVQWSPMKPESWSVWLPLKSSSTCSCRWLHCDFENVPCEHPNCAARTQHANSSESSSWLTEASSRISLFMSWGGPKCRHHSKQFMYCCDCLLPWEFCLSGCCLDTDLCNRYLGFGNLWEVPMEGSHTSLYPAKDSATTHTRGVWVAPEFT
jgi:hypothetical protein